MPKNSPEALKRRNEKRNYWKRTIPLDSFPHTIVKQCIECGEMKQCRWAATFLQTGQPEYRSRCIECQRLRYKRIRLKKQAVITVQARRRRRDAKARYIEYLGGQCERCGYNKCQRALTFHHRNRADKELSLSQTLDWSWVKIKAELDKCELVCFNCHMEAEDEYERQKDENRKNG